MEEDGFKAVMAAKRAKRAKMPQVPKKRWSKCVDACCSGSPKETSAATAKGLRPPGLDIFEIK